MDFDERNPLPAITDTLPQDATYSRTRHTLAVHDDNYRWLSAGGIDLILTDPPFNIARDTTFHTYTHNRINSYRFDKDKGWDSHSAHDFRTLIGQWATEFARVLRPGGHFAVFCADTYLSHFIDALAVAGLTPRRTLTWRKPNAVPINRQHMMVSACEYVIIGVKGSRATFNADLPLDTLGSWTDIEKVLVADKTAAVVDKHVRRALADVTVTGAQRRDAIVEAVTAAVHDGADEASERIAAMYVTDAAGHDILRGCVPNHVAFNSATGRRHHPTEKPVDLLRYLTALLSNPGDIVLDPFAGSGSTGVAASTLGRYAVLIETDPDYYTAAAGRQPDDPTTNERDNATKA